MVDRQRSQRQRTAWPLLLAALVVGVASCSRPSAKVLDADVAAAAADAVDVAPELDGGAVALPDVVSDSKPDVKPDVAFDAVAGSDIPYWILHDTDLSNLGIVGGNPYCANPYLEVQPNDPPHDPSCTSACPAPYPCTCGTCPWIMTPPMIVPRFDAEAIWTGEEVLIFGGQSQNGPGSGGPIPFTAERWNPSKDKGFSFIELPFAVTVGDQVYGDMWVKPIWTGNEALVLMKDHFFRFDPKTSLVQELPPSPVTTFWGNNPAVFWLNETLFMWGLDRATTTANAQAFKIRIVTWRSATGWQDVALPTDYVTLDTARPPQCITALGDSIYEFDLDSLTPAKGNGVDPKKPLMLRYSLSSKTWEALPQTMLPTVHCEMDPGNDGLVLFQSFPDGIVFIPATDAYNPATGKSKHAQVGEIWWKATGEWTTMKSTPISWGPLTQAQNHAKWTGSQFIINDVDFLDPIVGDFYFPPSSQDYPTWPIAYDPYTDEFHYLTSVGYPKHHRLGSTLVYGNSEIFMLGGTGGWGVDADGARLWLPKP